MNKTSPFFILDDDLTPDEPDEPQYTQQIFNIPGIPLNRPKIPSKFIKKWSEYADDTAVQKSVSAINGDMSFSLPIVKVNLTPLLKIDIDLVYMSNKDGIEYDVPLGKQFITVDHQKSVFKNDAIYYINSMGSKMTLENVKPNEFKLLEDIKGDVDVTYYPDQEYFVVESELEKFIYGKFGGTGTVLNELSYRHWRETGDDPKSLINIPVAWYLAERHSKSDGRSLYYHYETVDVPHALNQNVSYTSEVMLKSIDDGGYVKVEFGYGLKESSENVELKLKTDDGNLRMGNFLVDKHFLNRIQVETEAYTQDFGLTYDLFDGNKRILKTLTQVMSDGNSEEVLSMKNQKIFDKFLPSEIGVYHGVTTKFTYDNQVIPSPQLEKKFLLKNRPVISYGTNIMSFASIIDIRVVLKIFNIKTFKLVKDLSIYDDRTINDTSLQVGFSQNFMVVTYTTDTERSIRIYHQNGTEKWHDSPTIFKHSKESRVFTTGRDFVVVHDGLNLVILQKIWNKPEWVKYEFKTGDDKMKVFIKGKSIFLREKSNLHVVFKGSDSEWNFKLLKRGVASTAEKIANIFDVTDDTRQNIRKPLEDNEIRVMNNVVILSNLILNKNGQFQTVFNFITVSDNYEVEREDEVLENQENISDMKIEIPNDKTTLIVKYRIVNGKYALRVVDYKGEDPPSVKNVRNKNQREEARNQFIQALNSDENLLKELKETNILKWSKYYPIMDNGRNDLFFSEDIRFRMTGEKWLRSTNDNDREVNLGENFKLIFDKKDPNKVEMIGVKNPNYKLEFTLNKPHMLINMYPQYIAYQPDDGITKLIVFDSDGKSVVRHETFDEEELMNESNQGYFITIKTSRDLSHSEPYELFVRNMAQYQPEKPQVVIKMTEMSKKLRNWPQPVIGSSRNDIRVTSYKRTFNANKKLWTAVVKTMNGYTADENGWVEYLIDRNDEADIKQVTRYYDSDKKLLKSEEKLKDPTDDKDYSDNLLYDASGSLQISNFIPYKKSENAFGYLGFEDYEEKDGWNFGTQNIIKNGFALTGKNFLRLSSFDDKFEKSFIPKNKNEVFTVAAWIRSSTLNLNQTTDYFKAVISFSADGTSFTELYGILGKTKSKTGEWSNVEVSIDMPRLIRESYNNYKMEHLNLPDFDAVSIKITIVAFGPPTDSIDIDNVIFYPAPHRFSVNVFNDNRDAIAAIQNEGQITRVYYDSKNNKEIGRTRKNGKLEQFLIRSEGERDSPKIITKFSLSSGFHENLDKILFTNRWKMNNEQNWSVLPSELMYNSQDSDGIIEIRDEKIIDKKSAAIRLEVSLDSLEASKFEIKYPIDSIKFVSNEGHQAELNVNNRKIADIPKHFELAVFKYLGRTIIWIDGVIRFDEILSDTWQGFSLNFLGKVSVKDIFVLNNPKVEVFYHSSFDEKQQVVKLVSENSATVTQYIYDKYGREVLNTKPTKVIKSSSEPLLKFHRNFLKSFDPQTGKMDGDVVTENLGDEGFPYFRTKFFKNPLNEKQKVGQPGKDYSLQSNFATTYTKDIKIPFLNAYFPDNQGFTKHAEDLANGSTRILVLDKNENKVAKYVQVPNFDDLFMTFEHNSDGRIVKVLTPKYHETAKTLTRPGETYKIGDAHLSDEDKRLQDELCSHFKYDKVGNVIEKKTPDVGRQVLLYNSMNLLKFAITYNADPKDGQTIYYNYDSSGLLSETGHIIRPVSVEYLKKFVDSNFHTEAIEFQKIQFNEGKFKTIETINHDTTVLEEIQFDENEEDKIVSRKMTVPALTESLQTSFNLQRKYIGDNVEVMTYPTTDGGEILKVKNTYNGVGQLIGIGTVEKPFCFAKFTYDANGQPTNEVHELNNLNRNYSYNSPGYMSKIDDEFLSEDISYINGGYGQLGYGDGIVMKTAYNAKWSDEYFKNLDEKEKITDDNYDEYKDNDDYDEYKDGSLEKGEEVLKVKPETKPNADSKFNDPSRNKIVREKMASSTDSTEDSVEKRGNQELRFKDSSKRSERPIGNRVRSIRHTEKQPKPLSKLESILKNFKGFSEDNVAASLDLQQPSSNDQIPQNQTESSPNTHKSPQKRDTQPPASRQSKINNVLANPKGDSCISSLKSSNYLSNNSLRFTKPLNTNAEVNLPLKCYDDHIYDEISAKRQIPKHYGHRFTYGTHRELVKSKYFSTKDEEEAEPLQMSTFFDKIPGIEFYKSHNIFNILKDKNFISVDQRRTDQKSSIATRGTSSLIRDDDLSILLNELEQNELHSVVTQLILQTIGTKKIMNYSEFEKMFLSWKSALTNTIKVQQELYKTYAKKLFDGLIQQKLLPTSQDSFISPINKKLVVGLKQYTTSQIVDIVGVVSKSFNYELLTSAFDTASYEIDANGNHKNFATGFESVKLDYHENTSKLKSLNLKGEEFTVDHDGYGNMTSAPHKGVKKIIYHPVSRRVMEVLLNNGGSIKFHYNSQGERILKQVYDSKYEITKEILYIRDEDGNVLMDRVMNFDQVAKTCFEVVTHYIYGPRGMIGFIRDDKFHSIFTDHSGSVRLIIRDGKVVASYDYLPYGEMMRKFVSDDAADIRYLYHGKELDDEFDTYNFHARFYDPTIGRFLQTDPQSQYFSPYKFSGNSPVSFVDPNGEFSVLLAIGFGIFGAYISTAAHNKSFNPGKWDFKDPGTYLSLFSGAFSGALFPGSVVASWKTFYYIATPAAMAFSAYLSAAAANKSFNPAEWKFDDPETYSAIFSGLISGASIVKDVKDFKKYLDTVSRLGKVKLFVFASITAGGAIYATVQSNGGTMDFSKPEAYKTIFDGFSLGVTVPLNTVTIYNDIISFKNNPKAFKEFFRNLKAKDVQNLKHIFNDRKHPLYIFTASIGMGYLMGSAENKDFNPLNWNWKSVGTSSGIMSGIISGKHLAKQISVVTKVEIKAKLSSEWKDVKSIGTAVKGKYISFKRNVAILKTSGSQLYVRIASRFAKPNIDFTVAYNVRTQKITYQIKKEVDVHSRSANVETQLLLDRPVLMLSPCGARRRRKRTIGGICQQLITNWNSLKNYFGKKDLNAIFQRTVILPRMPTSTQKGFLSLNGGTKPTDQGEISIDDKKTPDSEPGLALTNKTTIEIDIKDRQKRDTFKPSIIISDQVPGSTIYTRENAGKLEIYHQYTEAETKIALTSNNNTESAFYDTKNEVKIQELENVKILRLFNNENNELKMNREVFEIPDDGIVKLIKNGNFEVLRSINSAPLREIANKNRQIRKKNQETLNKKLPNYTESCDTCKAIHWEDHLPAGVIDTAYNLNIDRQLKATVVIYKDDYGNWKLSSQLIQFNKEKGGAPEIAEIRPNPKIFDLKLTAKEAEEVKDNRSRKSRSVEFIPKADNIPARNYKFIDYSEPIVNRPTPSVLALGDFWLNATDFNSNLTLAYAFLKKWTNDTLFNTNGGNMPKITDIEFEIFANDLTIEFTENLFELSTKCGIPTVMQDILDDLNLPKISNEVKRKIENNLTEEIPKYLMREILEKNERKIVGKSSKKQFEKLRKLMAVYLEEFTDEMIDRNDKLWNGE